ncbi:MAG: type III-B CRISPR module RAMP protein Cmr6 [gamma proteobacterium endosymbiont of Lamellibrachia anaximandri]|nr:type III-B CRISPR module RAMP protein Cmr6 [gamma proteobacterium endosymbiont of Lamellibrachia anaximandri]MBL3535488.1 type III-B CRISPR module RAMP protein Cmr6 [gamma proteobacterium endosymbiont of Lamellibrachia anaximandri]
MIERPLYKMEFNPNSKPSKGHSGLWYERFFNGYDDKWSVDTDAKSRWIKSVTGECGQLDQLRSSAQNRISLLDNLGGCWGTFQSNWHFATGLGLPHPIENGFAWHPTLGVPYLPGASVKGLVRSWVESWDESLDEAQRKERLYRWFGTDSKDPKAQDEAMPMTTGGFIFFDAAPIVPATLGPDIMTPHMGKWYEKGDKDPMDPETMPGDWHDPVPVSFLVVEKATLLFSIAPRSAAMAEDLELVWEALINALEWLGAGAKTAVGYGRFDRDESAEKPFRSLLEGKRKEAEQRKIEAVEKAARATRSPLQNEMDDLIKKGGDAVAQLRNKLLKGDWLDAAPEDRLAVAQKIKAIQEGEGNWMPTSKKKKKEKKKCDQVQQVIDLGGRVEE